MQSKYINQYRLLAKDILVFAIRDYLDTLRKCTKSGLIKNIPESTNEKKRKEILQFFYSDWGISLCELVGVENIYIIEYLINQKNYNGGFCDSKRVD